jgi:hypothetical protein
LPGGAAPALIGVLALYGSPGKAIALSSTIYRLAGIFLNLMLR